MKTIGPPLLCLIAAYIASVNPVFGQVDAAGGVLSLPGPDTDRVCTLSPTDVSANYFLRMEDVAPVRPEVAAFADFEVEFENACGDNRWPAEAIEAFEYAVALWATHLESDVTIKIQAIWEEIEVLGSASPTRIIHSSNFLVGEEDTWYAVAQASAMAGFDFITLVGEEDFDIRLRLRCDFADWYFGTDGRPGFSEIDFVTVVLHEIGHGIGFIGTMTADPETEEAQWGRERNGRPDPVIYDRFVQDGDAISVLEELIYPNPSNKLYEAVTGQRGGLFFSGFQADRMYANRPVPLFAPSPWEKGSSYSHLNSNTFAQTRNALMRPVIDRATAVHTPGPVFCGILADTGWPIGDNCEAMIGTDRLIAIDRRSLDFGLTNVGAPLVQRIVIKNRESAEQALDGGVEIGGTGFSILSGGGAFTLQPGDSLEVAVQFDPPSTGGFEGLLSIFHNANNELNPVRAGLTGEALDRDELARLDQNFPNPFRASTQINYALPEDSNVRIDIYDITGRHIETLVNEHRPAGEHQVIFNAGSQSSGVYFYRILVNNFSKARKFILAR